MNWVSRLKTRLPVMTRTRRKPSGRVLVAHWDRERVHYVVTTPGAKRLRSQDAGSVPLADQSGPLTALAEHLRAREIQVQHLIVLLSRPEIDVLTLDLPPSEVIELPALVQGEVERQLGESETPPIVDFCASTIARGDIDKVGQQVLAFAMTAASLETLRSDAVQAGFRLSAVSFRQMCALSRMRRGASNSSILSVSVQVYHGEIEFAFCVGSQPLMLRSVRISLDDMAPVAEQLVQETDRCLTLLPPETEELPKHWFIDASSPAARQLAQALRNLGQAQVHSVQYATGDEIDRPISAESQPETQSVSPENEDPSSTPASPADADLPGAALAGAVWDFAHDGLLVNLADPKRSPPPPSPWVRPAAWSAAACAAFAILGTVLLSDVWQLRDQVQALEVQLTESKKLEAKALEKSDQVAVVEQWLSDQVNWLGVLSEISQRVPDGRNATIRRLSASAGASTGVIDLSVQVLQPDDISELEERLRSVKYSVSSKRISQSPESAEFPWQFETRIDFSIDKPDWSRYGAAQPSKTESSVFSNPDRTATETVLSDRAEVNQLTSANSPQETRVEETQKADEASPDAIILKNTQEFSVPKPQQNGAIIGGEQQGAGS
ncbi:MAG TPA: hypothetical protein DCF63_16130 [Planctomycetaceae bacterium]|nr:hypothetical protein [Planctomycetaceae bacterium]